MKDFQNKIAVVTGAASGMGYELALSLAKSGCHVAACDLFKEGLDRLIAESSEKVPEARVTAHQCDVALEASVISFRDEVMASHDTDHIHLLFNNAGIGGGGSLISDDRASWERTFNVCWFGVYYCTRAFMPMLIAADAAYIVNTSSVNGFWASVGPSVPHTSYSAAKFAVKGFSEALIADLRVNAPHVKVAVVMPGHIGTGIVENSTKILGHAPQDMSAEEVDAARQQMIAAGLPVSNVPDDQIRQLMDAHIKNFRASAPTTSAQAADEILVGVRQGKWRILVGDDARFLDELVRSSPEDAYEPEYIAKVTSTGHLKNLVQSLETEGGAPKF